MNRELNVKLKLDNGLYLEAMKQIIDTTSIFRDEIDKVKDKLNELSSIKTEIEINHNAEEATNKIQEVIDRIQKLKENSQVTIDIQSKVSELKEEKEDEDKYKDIIENTKAVYDNTIGTAKKDEGNREMLTYSLGSKEKSGEAMNWISNQNSSVSEEELMKGIIQAKNSGLDYKKVVSAAADTSAATGKSFSEVMDVIMKVNEGKANEVRDQLKAMGINESQLKNMPGVKVNNGGKIKGNPNKVTQGIVNNIGQRYSGASRTTTNGLQAARGTMQNTRLNIGRVLNSGSNNSQINASGNVFKRYFKNVGTGFKQIRDISKIACKGIIKSVGQVFSMVLTNPIVGVISLIIGMVVLLYKAWTENWGGIRDKFQPIVDTIKKAIDSISPIIQKVIDIISKLLGIVLEVWDAVTGFLSNPIQGVIDIVAKVRGKGEDTSSTSNVKSNGKSRAGNNALGTSYWNGGITWVGENGPELIDLPSGSQVFDNRTSKNMMGNNFSIPKLADTIVVREDADIDRIANALARKLKTTSINMA
ncbi:DNA-binding transcriptional MerR regulator [Clostridium tetanomorphum]|uniref:Uncharacterized protein n=2 Tax=Clostridium TaxID=1485 RepID=A0A923EBP9_CLOTT|nr:hypothetical protein [Clostridium tetanomorphum]KAJ51088.1 phage protein [Clostridium tetanomorphum DSM 665]MBC2398009.1 hypothetical protein [Clostridium tetanomorphum]MBP1864484.1 DNA-binding transcriptional MerR regulator [Clostridium tetanomorphum]NRS82985.1 DNA-binding transcriptional MerR regulator [Clostridium tetanomorphum]NRZ98919.1 DNA-binding transcriptional MerR regulator [Clostridium tetanomorphum]